MSSPGAICCRAPYMKSIGPKSAVCSPNRKAVDLPVTGAVTSHTVQIPHIGSHTPASNSYAWSQWSVRKSDAFPASILMGKNRTYPVARTSGSKVSVSITLWFVTLALFILIVLWRTMCRVRQPWVCLWTLFKQGSEGKHLFAVWWWQFVVAFFFFFFFFFCFSTCSSVVAWRLSWVAGRTWCYKVLDLWTSYRESCGFWTVHRVIGHHIASFGPMDFI